MKKHILLLTFFLLVVGVFATSAGAAPWKFAVFCDSRGSDNGVDTTVLGEIATRVAAEDVDLVIFPGDLIQSGGTSEFQTWRNTMAPIYNAGIEVYPVRGNHDDDSDSAWTNKFSADIPNNGPSGAVNFSFSLEHENALFIGFDNYIHDNIPNSWIEDLLDSNTKPHIFAYSHQPAFKVDHNDCLDDNASERNNFVSSFTAAGGRVYFCGHDHFLDILRADDGDGDPDDDFIQYLVGTAGAPLYDAGSYNGNNGSYTPINIEYSKSTGYTIVEVDDDNVTLTYYYKNGNQFHTMSYTVGTDDDDSIKINFQPSASSVPSGYLADDGSVYGDRGNGYSYGWVGSANSYTRDRGVDSDQRYDTLNHIQKTDDRTWELELPNGDYVVDLVMGDPSNTDQINDVSVEGIVIDDPDGEDNFDEYLDIDVTITDGKLTISALATGDNAKVCFIDILILDPDEDTDPPTPNPATFSSAPSADSDTAISMTATTGSDASGPVKYLFTETSGNPGGSSSSWQTNSSYTDSGLDADTQYTYTVRMRDALNNSGTVSSPASATTDTESAAIRDWTNGDTDRAWDNSANWSDGAVPRSIDKAAIRNASILGPIIDSGTTALANNMVVGDWSSTADTVDMTGGSLTTTGWIILGHGDDNNGTFTISGGTVSVGDNLKAARAGIGTIDMTGGSVTIAGSLVIAEQAGSTGNVYLDGGTISSGSIDMTSDGWLDIAGGTLIVDGDVETTIDTYISSDWITGYGGAGTLDVDYNISNAGKTTVTATAGAGWTEIQSDNFEGGWGNWNDGGDDCRRQRQ